MPLYGWAAAGRHGTAASGHQLDPGARIQVVQMRDTSQPGCMTCMIFEMDTSGCSSCVGMSSGFEHLLCVVLKTSLVTLLDNVRCQAAMCAA